MFAAASAFSGRTGLSGACSGGAWFRGPPVGTITAPAPVGMLTLPAPPSLAVAGDALAGAPAVPVAAGDAFDDALDVRGVGAVVLVSLVSMVVLLR